MEKRYNKQINKFRPGPKRVVSGLVMGIHPVLELLNSDKQVQKILISRDLHGKAEVEKILERSREKKVPIQVVPVEKLNRVTAKNHQGILAFSSPINFQKIENILPWLYEQGVVPFFLILDRITDVRNFGAIVRTAECAGVHAVIIPEKESAQINEDAIKTSAGALHHIPVCREQNLEEVVAYLKDYGLKAIACTEKGEGSLFGCQLKDPLVLILGSEEDGISPQLLKLAHQSAYLPLAGQIGSLNVGAAGAVAMYETLRQRSETH